MDISEPPAARETTGLDTLDNFLDEEGIREGVTTRALATIQCAKVRYADQGYAITQPVIVHSRADIASLLRAHRISLGKTCEDIDHRAGWSDRYLTKLEHGDTPSGKRGFTFRQPDPDRPDDGGAVTMSPMAEVWPECYGLSFVLMPTEIAKSIGAVPAPVRVVG